MVKAPSSSPYAWGESPFRIKGLGYRGHVEHTNQVVPGGLARALAVTNDPALQTFFAQPFLAASWYDIFPLVKLGAVCASLTGLPYREYLIDRTRRQAQADLSSVYHQLLLWIAQPGSVARRIPGMVSRYFNFAQAQVVEEGAGFTRGISDRFPLPLLTWYEPVVTTWLLEALRMAGAQQPHIELTTRPCAVPHEAGIELVELHWRLSWEAA